MKVRLTSEERDRIIRFHLAFNKVEQAIKRRFGSRGATLPELMRALTSVHPSWKHEDALRALAKLRNDVAHAGGTDALRAVPTERSIEELGQIRRSIEWL